MLTIEIINKLNRFENIHDLPTDIVTSLLIDEALRDKISNKKPETEIVDYIKDVIVKDHKELKEKFQKVIDEHQYSKKEINDKDKELNELKDRLSSLEKMIHENKKEEIKNIKIQEDIIILKEMIAIKEKHLDEKNTEIERISQNNELLKIKNDEKLIDRFFNKFRGCQNLCVNGSDHTGTLSPK